MGAYVGADDTTPLPAVGRIVRMSDRYDIPADDDALLAECDVQVFRGSGPGGQSVNTADSAVRLRHRPSGITWWAGVSAASCRTSGTASRGCAPGSRSTTPPLDAPRRVPTRKSRAAKARQVEAKRRRSRVKHARGRVDRREE